MKKEYGVTLTALVIYIIVMLIAIGVISAIMSEFHYNTISIENNTEEILKFNKFNMFFLKEIKSKENKVNTINENYILFKTGNSFSLSGDKIYYNNLEICDKVQGFTILQGKNGDSIATDIIYITISFENFAKSINYKIEEIY